VGSLLSFFSALSSLKDLPRLFVFLEGGPSGSSAFCSPLSVGHFCWPPGISAPAPSCALLADFPGENAVSTESSFNHVVDSFFFPPPHSFLPLSPGFITSPSVYYPSRFQRVQLVAFLFQASHYGAVLFNISVLIVSS